ncbi:ADP-ribose 1''-phosphate phosphatase [Spathaspora passalidarum NRRL Y-27907]|uniref:ADP-ribose 1''-phosphate phosphatase n=1 Tax=Spathaspora passalidarum (strain NRRL Y-27907 / 11-Y1) TaxID=619300 RepID=G3ANG7_SPAPN|nr:ADP-ribose 1''-phosphate phosphatase [Spathaspora passalidarum NRRL Y-27907]EGW31956.1 ADP-ribose 1''-phosphate phosphatase [Spathaspora passalidarum NRRL Y-27907]
MIKYIKGDLFSHKSIDISKSVILAHACNTHGAWGGGIAAVFGRQFPTANTKYSNYCHTHSNLLGTTLLIPANDNNKIFIACLFTSDFSQTPTEIVEYTDKALEDLSKQLASSDLDFETDQDHPIINMPKINAGIFGVPWELTEGALMKHTSLNFNVYVID